MVSKIHNNTDLMQSNEYGDVREPLGVFCCRNDLWIHWHESIEILYIQDGDGVFYLQDERIPVAPGDILFVNRGHLHSGHSIGNRQLIYYAIVLNRNHLGIGSPDPLYAQYISPLLEGRLLFPNSLKDDSPVGEKARRLLDEIIRESAEKAAGYEINVKALLFMLMVLVTRHYLPKEPESNRQLRLKNDTERFAPLFAYLEEHYNEPISIAQASGMLQMSPFHFCKTLRRFTGRTFVDILNLYRIKAAEELLRQTSLTVTQIAEKSGFCNINYFCRVFKHYKGYAPSKCRRKEAGGSIHL